MKMHYAVARNPDGHRSDLLIVTTEKRWKVTHVLLETFETCKEAYKVKRRLEKLEKELRAA